MKVHFKLTKVWSKSGEGTVSTVASGAAAGGALFYHVQSNSCISAGRFMILDMLSSFYCRLEFSRDLHMD